MAEFLLEILSEEIPARMQDRARADLATMVSTVLDEAGLDHGDVSTFATPRRLCLVMENVAIEQADREIERRGPRSDAPEKARDGFLRSLGDVDYVLGEVEDKKGRFILARYTEKGRTTRHLLEEALPGVLAGFPWPKSMRHGDDEARWVRPLHGILARVGNDVLDMTFSGVQSGSATRGHRFMAPTPFEVSGFADYAAKLEQARVVLDGARRRETIARLAADLARGRNLRLREDEALLDELKGIVEWPVPLLGRIDDGFMELPEEVLVTSMREHQRYLALEDDAGKLAPFFITVANIEAPDGGKAIIEGNERVLRARLWDAKFFWDLDRKSSLESRLDALVPMVFHAELGSLCDKVNRVERLAGWLAAACGADETCARQAGLLAKSDLVSGMVGEFPELQGIMGGYYARHEGLDERVATAIAQHYRPQGPADSLPESAEGVAVALADKFDTLVGFFAAGIRPTGSKDPFALRRAALSIIRLLLEKDIRLDLRDVVEMALAGYGERFAALDGKALGREIIEFLHDRLAVQQRGSGTRHDVVRAVSSREGSEDLVDLAARASAVQQLLDSEAGSDLLAAYRRANNILQIEAGKDGVTVDHFNADIDEDALHEETERELYEALRSASAEMRDLLDGEKYAAAMMTAAGLRSPIDRFFEKIMVNSENPQLRSNRLRLLAGFVLQFDDIADFSVIET
ncbi:MAG: glycine--tRNA ligase subunit beta [Geminicoccaceae bacterium]|nr:glycine--tRNA ligase subunit beta [Geminicoccaceae bacterium]